MKEKGLLPIGYEVYVHLGGDVFGQPASGGIERTRLFSFVDLHFIHPRSSVFFLFIAKEDLRLILCLFLHPSSLSSSGLPVGALINCCDNSGAKNLYIIAVKVRRHSVFNHCTLSRISPSLFDLSACLLLCLDSDMETVAEEVVLLRLSLSLSQ